MESLLLFEVRFSISKVDSLECSPGTLLTPPQRLSFEGSWVSGCWSYWGSWHVVPCCCSLLVLGTELSPVPVLDLEQRFASKDIRE